MKKPLNRKDFFTNNQIKFQTYGVTISVKAQCASYLEKTYSLLEQTYTDGVDIVSDEAVEFKFYIKRVSGKGYELYRNGEIMVEVWSRDVFFDSVESQIRITVGEFAPEKVFLHAGVIGWKGKAIIIPARSYAGKTTLVAELVKKGASYYSDEYAVLDSEAQVLPFPKWLSLRGIISDDEQLNCSVESLGGTAGTEPIPVQMILIMQFDKTVQNPRRWKPERLTAGQGMMEILPHTLPIRNKPKFVLEVLKKLTTRAIIVKTARGEAYEFADTLLNYLEYQTD